MNLFISPLSAEPLGIFFDQNTTHITDITFPKSKSFIEVLQKFPEISVIEKIFYVSGPASFTSLRNMSVFLNIFQKFSEKKIELFAIPSGQFFQMHFPHAHIHILSVGRREGFVFKGYNLYGNASAKYTKYKNQEIIEQIFNQSKTHPELTLAGIFSEQFLEQLDEKFLENNPKNFPKPAFSFPLEQKEFLEILIQHQEKFAVPKGDIDYGAKPNIG